MARYNTLLSSQAISAAGSITDPRSGSYVFISGTAPYTITVPNPTLYRGAFMTFYNSTAGNITLSTPAGIFSAASGTSTVVIAATNTFEMISDGTNWVAIMGSAASQTVTTLVVNTGLTINPSNVGTLNNVTIGGTTAQNGTFNTLVGGNSTTAVTINNATVSTAGTNTLNVTGGGTLQLASGASYNVQVAYPNLTAANSLLAVPNRRYVDSVLTTSRYWAHSW